MYQVNTTTIADWEDTSTSRLSLVLVTFLRGLCIAGGLLAFLLLPSFAAADEDGLKIHGKGSASGRGDFDNAGGSFRTDSYGATATWKDFYVDYTRTNYHWRDSNKMSFSRGDKPWESLNVLKVGARLTGDLETENFGWFWHGGLVVGWEEDLRDAFGVQGAGGLTYQFSPEFSGKVGVGGTIHPGLLRLGPVASLDWNTPQDIGPSVSLGFPETMFRYRTEEAVTLRAGAKVDSGGSPYRLADDSSVHRKGYVTTQGITAGVYVDVAPAEGLTATVGLEYDMERKYEIRNSDGNRRQKFDVEDTPSLQFSLGYRF